MVTAIFFSLYPVAVLWHSCISVKHGLINIVSLKEATLIGFVHQVKAYIMRLKEQLAKLTQYIMLAPTKQPLASTEKNYYTNGSPDASRNMTSRCRMGKAAIITKIKHNNFLLFALF